MTDKDDLFKGIDDAADNLFGQYLVKKPQSVTPSTEEPPASESSSDSPLPQKPESAAESPDIESGSSLSATQAAEGTAPLAQMEEALLSIDWEVNQTNLSTGREALKKLIARYDLNTESPASQVANLMDKVLALMQDNPETIPVSAPSQLSKALEALREAVSQGSSPTTDINESLSRTVSELQSVVASRAEEEGASGMDRGPESDISMQAASVEEPAPETEAGVPSEESAVPESSADYGLKLSLESDTDHERHGTPVASETTQVLKTYRQALEDAVRTISPMEKLFANRAGMEKLHSVHKLLREKLAGQVQLLSQTFSGDYSNYSGFGTVNGWLESQLDVLNPCIKRLVKVENLFGKTTGYEKLHELTKKARTSLVAQQEAITIAVGGTPVAHQFDLTGEYPSLQPVIERAPAAAVSAVTDPQALLDDCLDLARKIETGEEESVTGLARLLSETLEKVKSALAGIAIASPGASAAAQTAISAATDSRSSKCRWDWLLKTSWGSQLVGLAPEQVVYESSHTFPLKDFRDKTYFSLKKLKSFPWTNLQSLFSGDLAELDKATLNEMELEIARPPETFRGSTQKKVYLAIMYHQGKGKVFLLDSPTEAISIADEGVWAPSSQDQDIVGTLTMYGSIMPVIAVD